MSAYHEIFVKPTVAGADLLRDVEALLGVHPMRHTDGGEGYVVGYDDAWIDIYLFHELVDAAGLRFSQYPCYLTIRLPGGDEAASLALARRIYRLLVDSGRYEAFIVWNDSVLVE